MRRLKPSQRVNLQDQGYVWRYLARRFVSFLPQPDDRKVFATSYAPSLGAQWPAPKTAQHAQRACLTYWHPVTHRWFYQRTAAARLHAQTILGCDRYSEFSPCQSKYHQGSVDQNAHRHRSEERRVGKESRS